MKKTTQWFSMIEILIGIFIFTLGLASIYALLISTLNMNEYSKNSIIATNLSREAIESIRNIRDNNYNNLYKWNKFPGTDTNKIFSTWVYYQVENDFTTFSDETVRISEISDFVEWKDHILAMDNYQLCFDDLKRYTYDCSADRDKTWFYRYVKFDEVVYNSWWVNTIVKDALKVTSKVIWYKKWYHEIELKTILTDYLRQ